MTSLPRTVELLTGRDLSIGHQPMPPRLRRAKEIGIAIEQGRAEVQAARIRGLQRVTEEAMRCAGDLTLVESYWMQRVPYAAGRFQHLADTAAMSAADIVAETGRG